MKTKSKHPKRWFLFILGFASIFDGLISIISLGYVTSDTVLKMSFWYARRK